MDPVAIAGEPPSATTDAEAPSAMADLDAARAAFIEAIRSHDPSAVAGLYGDGARLVAPESEVIRGRDDVTAFWRAGMDSGIAEVELEPDDLDIFPTVAWEVGRYTLRFESVGLDPVIDRGRYLLVYALDTGRWRRAAEMFSPDALGRLISAAPEFVLQPAEVPS